ncbi:hypothetical protein [Actinocorallia populi]|uniref:hypothetical protein n=1 Tax=Actinocorallia populi TaxID=2079200 RepID=UPI000D091DD2|nr:hypothetical protein [Actinocorallia populi]
MSRVKILMAAAVTAVTAVSVTASPASAWPAGDLTATLEEDLSFTWALGTDTCTSSALEGSITSGGAITIDTAVFGGCTGTISSIEALPVSSPSARTAWPNLFWSWNLTPTSGYNYDGLLSVTGFRVAIRLNVLGGITCVYTSPFSGYYYHGTNPKRPLSYYPYLQFRFPGVPVPKAASGSHWFCPNTVTTTGVWVVPGIV